MENKIIYIYNITFSGSILISSCHIYVNIYRIIKYNNNIQSYNYLVLILFILSWHFKNYIKNNLYKFKVIKSNVTNKQYKIDI